MMVPFFSAAIKASSSTTLPRAILIRMPFGQAPRALRHRSCSASRPARRDNHDHIDVARHLDQICIIFIGDFGILAARMINHRHFHRFEPAGDRLANAAHPDHTDGAIAQGRPAQRKRLLEPFAVPQIAFAIDEIADRAQQERKRGVCGLLGSTSGVLVTTMPRSRA